MALDSSDKAPPAKSDPASTAVTVEDVVVTAPPEKQAHPAPVPSDLPSHQYVHHQGTAMGAPVAPQLLVGPPPGVLVEQRVVGKRLRPEGWLAVCLLGIFFWPLMCVPCCLPQCQEDVVETVYISPIQAPPVQYVQQR